MQMRLNIQKISIMFLAVISSCSFFKVNFTSTEDKYIREMVDGSKINLHIKENYERIFMNSFYDMTDNRDRVSGKTPIKTTISISMQKVPSGQDMSALAMYYDMRSYCNYTVYVDREATKADDLVLEMEKNAKFPSQRQFYKDPLKNKDHNRIAILNDRVVASQQYAGNPVNLFAEYVAETKAQENLGQVLAREFYYNTLLGLRLHILQCKKIKSILMETRFSVFANDRDESNEDRDLIHDSDIADIDLKNIKKKDYLIYENHCTFF